MTTIDTSALAATTNTASATESVISSDFETFLKMLTVQMENQDPLNPVDSSDYATQLATFSSVEQQVLTNDLLSGLTSMISTSSMSELANWVGHEVRAAASGYYDGMNDVTVAFETQSGATSAELVVTGADGAEVDRISINPDSETFAWSGDTEGAYGFSIISYQDGVQIGSQQAQVYVPVTEVRSTPSGIELVLKSSDVIATTDVTALRKQA